MGDVGGGRDGGADGVIRGVPSLGKSVVARVEVLAFLDHDARGKPMMWAIDWHKETKVEGQRCDEP